MSIRSWPNTTAYRAVFVVYSLVGLIKFGLTLLLSPSVEIGTPTTKYHEVGIELEGGSEDFNLLSDEEPDVEPSNVNKPLPPTPSPSHSLSNGFTSLLPEISTVSHASLFRPILLFGVDAFASGLSSPSWLTYFFASKHRLSPAFLGLLFLVTILLSSLSNFASSPLVRRIGSLNTIVFTQFPSAIFLGLIPFPNSTLISMTFLVLRACTQGLDQAPRQAFIASTVPPAKRTAIMGTVEVINTLVQSGGIGFAGWLASRGLWIVVLGVAGALKAGHYLLLLLMSLGTRDQDETEGIHKGSKVPREDDREVEAIE